MHSITIPTLLLLGSAVLPAAVVVNETMAIDALPQDDAKALFLGAKTTWSDGKTVSLALPTGGGGLDAFLDAHIGKPRVAFDTHWKRLVFTGKAAMPKRLDGDEEVIAYVAQTPNAIGVVSDGKTGSGIKVVPVK